MPRQFCSTACELRFTPGTSIADPQGSPVPSYSSADVNPGEMIQCFGTDRLLGAGIGGMPPAPNRVRGSAVIDALNNKACMACHRPQAIDWYKTLHTWLVLEMGFVRSENGKAVWLHPTRRLKIGSHVNDCILRGKRKHHTWFWSEQRRSLKQNTGIS